MIDVFISFTGRGGTDLPWIMDLRKNLMESYRKNYGKDELVIWEMSEGAPGEDFEKNISAALEKTLILLLVLDPSFNDSPQVMAEIDKYQSARKAAGEPVLFIKIIKWRGEQEEQLIRVVNSNLLVSYFSKKKPNEPEREFDKKSNEYKNEVEKIVKEIRKHKIDNRRKSNAQKLLNRLQELNNVPKIYVALGDANLTPIRARFINQLNETIKKDPNKEINDVKVIPDDFTTEFEFDHQALCELLCEENPYRDKCISAMLNDCTAVIIPFENDNRSEAESHLKRIKHQLKEIKDKAVDLKKRLPVYFLLNIPQELFKIDEFKNEFDNPAYSAYNNIKLKRNEISIEFINSFVEDLTALVVTQVHTPAKKTNYNIYIIEGNNSKKLKISPQKLIEEEKNRASLWEYIINHHTYNCKFTLLKPGANISLKERVEYHKFWLPKSDGIIIYRGIREDDEWWQQQQTVTYKVILELKEQKLKDDLLRAIYIDPLQENRFMGSYAGYDYNVIINHPEELENFLCKLQQH